MKQDVEEIAEETHGQDFTSGNLRSQLWSVSWPIMLSVFFYTLYNIVDAIWVGRISPEAIAAVSISQISLFVMVSLGMGITVGSGVVLAMHIGSNDKAGAGRVLGQSFVLSALLALLFTFFSLAFRETILTLSGAQGAVFDPALTYFTIVAAGSILLFLMMNIVFAFNAQGDTFTPTKLFAASTGLNLILDPLLIFGWGAIPALGISGAAYATLISQMLFVVTSIFMLSRDSQLIPFRWRNLVLDFKSTKQVLNIGFPASLTQVIQPLGIAVLMLIVAQSFAEMGTVAFSIAFRIEFFAYLPAIGFGVGAMAVIGQNIGAGNLNRAWETYKMALTYSAGAALVLGLLAIAGAKFIVAIFTSDPAVVASVTSYILVVGLSYGFLAASLVEVSGFQSIGRSWPGFWLFVLRLAVISIPIAYITTIMFNLPIISVWVALAIGNVIAAILGYWWFKRTFNSLSSTESADSTFRNSLPTAQDR